MSGARRQDLRFTVHMRKSITKRAVDALNPGQFIADDEVLGFVVRRLPSGRLSYGYRYSKDGGRRWIRLGVGITPDAARKGALIHAGNVAQDRDPLTDREKKRQEKGTARTLDQVLDAFIKNREREKGLRSIDEMKSLLARFVRPKFRQTLHPHDQAV